MVRRAEWTKLTQGHAAVFALLSVSLLAWAVWAMRRGRLRILPEPHPQTVLITDGPYRYLRHPMYTSVLLGAGALISTHNSLDMLVAWLMLLVVLWVKLGYEERLLDKRFPGYRIYRKSSWRLIPFI